MTTRIRKLLLAATAAVCISAAIAGCGKKDEAPPQTQEQQQLRNQKKGD